MNKLFTILMSMFLMITCSDKSVVGPPSEPEAVGCEGAGLYVWDDLTYSDILGENETTWLYFEVDSLGYYSVLFNSGGFECNIYDKCKPDDLAAGDTLLRSFVSVEQQMLDIGPVSPGDYFLSMHNTRNRAEFNFTIIVSDIVPGCTDYTAENYSPGANYDIGICEYVVIVGCMNELACNYNSLAEEDDGSCVLAEENFDCDGKCLVDEDCNGLCGGTAKYAPQRCPESAVHRPRRRDASHSRPQRTGAHCPDQLPLSATRKPATIAGYWRSRFVAQPAIVAGYSGRL